MNDIVRIKTNARRGRAAIYNGVIYLSGSAADDRTQDIRGQTEQTLARIDKILGDAGTDKSRILRVEIWLKDIARDFAAMNEVWDAWVLPESAPARAAAQCPMGADDVLVEMIVTAAVGL